MARSRTAIGRFRRRRARERFSTPSQRQGQDKAERLCNARNTVHLHVRSWRCSGVRATLLMVEAMARPETAIERFDAGVR